MKKNWWKVLAIVLLAYTIIGGFLFEAPRLVILNETIRALYFHVPMWFGMIFLLLISIVYAVKYLSSSNPKFDNLSLQFARIGVLFGVLGIVTGMVWAKFTWGDYWSNDPKQNAAAVGLLIYFAYFVLRNSLIDEQQRARIGAIYNIFAFAILIPLLFILPRLTDSLHPGNGGNPGFNAYDMDSKLRMIFYPAVIGWTLAGAWIAQLKARIQQVEEEIEELEIS